MMRLEVTPDNLDVVEFGRIFRQPLNREPMGTFSECGHGRLTDVDRAVVEHNNDRLDERPGLWAVEAVENVQMSDEVCASLGAGGGDDELALHPIERAHHGNLLGLPRGWHAQVRAAFGPGTGEIGMRQRLAL